MDEKTVLSVPTLWLAVSSSDSLHIHKWILQVGFCAILYQMYFNCHSRRITSSMLLSSANLVIPSKKQSSCLWNDLFLKNTCLIMAPGSIIPGMFSDHHLSSLYYLLEIQDVCR